MDRFQLCRSVNDGRWTFEGHSRGLGPISRYASWKKARTPGESGQVFDSEWEVTYNPTIPGAETQIRGCRESCLRLSVPCWVLKGIYRTEAFVAFFVAPGDLGKWSCYCSRLNVFMAPKGSSSIYSSLLFRDRDLSSSLLWVGYHFRGDHFSVVPFFWPRHSVNCPRV